MSTTHPQIKAQRRTTSGRGAARQLRRNGLVPAVIYGSTMKSESLQVDEKTLRTILLQATSSNFVIDLTIEGGEGKKAEKRLAILQARQADPLTKKLLHVDFHGVSADETIHAFVGLEFVGTPLGAKKGGLLDSILHSIEVNSKPDELPEVIEVDVSGLEIGDVLHIGDLKLPKGVTPTGDAGTPVVTVTEPRVAEPSSTAAEPEVAAPAATKKEAEEA